jgi:hypothetical protein
MSNQKKHSSHNIYLLDPEATSQQLFDATSACLKKAEALSMVAASIDLEAYSPDIIGNYLWTVGDLVREASWLYQKLDVTKM